MAPGSLSHHINLHHFIIALLLLFTLHLYIKNTKNIIYHLYQISLSYSSGNFHYRTWLVYSNDGLPQSALGLHEQASWMHTHLVYFVELSYTYSSSASVAWQSLLTHIDIY